MVLSMEYNAKIHITPTSGFYTLRTTIYTSLQLPTTKESRTEFEETCDLSNQPQSIQRRIRCLRH